MRMTLANILTVSRLFIAPIFLAFVLTDSGFGMTVAVILMVVGAMTDWFDGYLARKYGEESDLGKFLDPLADKVLTSAAFTAFYIEDVMPLWMVIVIVVRDFGVTAMRSVAEERGTHLVTSRNAKAKTFLQMTFIVFALTLMWLIRTAGNVDLKMQCESVLYSSYTYGAMLFITLFTLWTAVEYVVGNRNLFMKVRNE